MTKRFNIIIILICLCVSISSLYAPWVNGYYRRNGTYVQGYWRTKPNAYKWDNRNFNKWNSPYITDWYNQSYFNDKEFYNTLKELEKTQKALDKELEELHKSNSYNPYQTQNSNNLYLYDDEKSETESNLFKYWNDDGYSTNSDDEETESNFYYWK